MAHPDAAPALVTADDFLAWSALQDGRFELIAGHVLRMTVDLAPAFAPRGAL